MSEEEIREQAQANVYTKLWVRLAVIVIGVLVASLCGVAVSVGIVLAAVGGAAAAAAAVRGGAAAGGGGESNRRIVILGKTGVGKSKLANTIFGEEMFMINHTANSGTRICKAKTKSVNGRSITLIDTPGFFDTDRSEEEMKPEIVRCITECAPGPHAFLIVLKVETFTEHEQAVVNKIKECFSDEVFKYATVVFTHGDQLPEGQTIEDFFCENKPLSDLVKKCRGRCHVIDNKYWNQNPNHEYRSNQFQVEELLKTIDKMVKNNGSCYTNEMLQLVEEEIKQEEEKIMQSSENMSEEVIREQAKANVSTKLLVRLAGVGTGALLGALCGVVMALRIVLAAVKAVLGPVEAAAAAAAAARAAGRGAGGGESNRRIVIVGKTGVGKSSLANTIFGEKLFQIGHTANSGTRKCEAETKSVNGRSITLIDTPGFFDTDRSEEKLKPEIVRCITECAPGPHAFLIVLKVEKFTEHEQAVINKIKEYFSEEAFKYATVVFTHGDQLPEGQTIEDYVRQNRPLSDLVKKCGGRCHVIDNKYWNQNPKHEYRSNQFQVEKLLNTIERMVMENNGSCYTNEMLQLVEEEIEQEGENIRLLAGNMSEEEIREQAKANVSTKLWVRLSGIGTGVLVGALCGVVMALAIVLVAATKGIAARVKAAAAGGAAVGGAGGVGAAAAAAGALIGVTAAVGAVCGGVRGYYACEGAETAGEAAENVFKAVKNDALNVYKSIFERK